MLSYRIIVLLLVITFTACMTCSILFPIFRKVTSDPVEARHTVRFWYKESTNTITSTGSSGELIMRYYTHNLACQQARVLYVALSALSVAAAGISGVACLVIACWTTAGYNVSIGVVTLLLTSFAMASAVAVVGVTTYVYTHDFCVNDPTAFEKSPQRDGYHLAEGFILLCAAAGGFLLMVMIQVIGFCCGCQPLTEFHAGESHPKSPGDSGRSDGDLSISRN
ncbi:hypothetical protein Q4I30_002460 [Leishmania utingensis]|uniref:Amastin-like protein n=1 Tax=Leishmania utingensis TaxID=653362 RepID=A0AAW3ARQ7_9TRYP